METKLPLGTNQSEGNTMTDIEAIDILQKLVVKLENEMRFEEREAVEVALGVMIRRRHPSNIDIAQNIFEIAKFQSEQYKMGLM
jgi:hypothetical protein